MINDQQNLTPISWWMAKLAAPFPAGIVAALVMHSTDALGRLILSCALTWAAGAVISAWSLEIWHWITRRFDTMSGAKVFTIAAIIGAPTALVAASIASDPVKSTLAIVAAILGSLQGAAVVWFIVGPDLAPPPVWQNDPETEDEDGDDTPNPTTSPP